jgi:topoisomerase-4 subunit A
MIHLEKWHPERVVSTVYYEGEKEDWYVKRFLPELVQKPFSFVGDHENSRLGVLSTAHHPMVRIRFNRRFKETRDRDDEVFDASDFIAVKGIRALGNKLSSLPVTEVQLDPLDDEKEQSAQTIWESKHQVEQKPSPTLIANEAAEQATDQFEEPITDLENPIEKDTERPEPPSADDAESKTNGGGIQPTLF